ncbi:hypothetical protein [Nostoc sp. DedQUE09]|uniref:hypothetical protein n=1 Tax=Nostoc sp. DedQUE09 TaxID=3075394 RepID=UPI002AD48663|nr:hypothetical protein [Nostoc sp. DedQUE09]MDZ7952686.1 hypothetical protein [Nostoc sp. DedQUE09]
MRLIYILQAYYVDVHYTVLASSLTISLLKVMSDGISSDRLLFADLFNHFLSTLLMRKL